MAEQIEDPVAQNRYVLTGSEKYKLEGNADEIVRLQALLAQWLRMENVVILAGAGCSCAPHIGGKALAGLESAALDLLEAYYGQEVKKGQKRNENIETLIKGRKADENCCGFEQWLSYLSNLHYLLAQGDSPVADVSWKGDTKLSRQNLSDLLQDLEKAIYAYCALSLPDPFEKPTGHHEFIAKLLARDPSLGRTHLFTNNYDTVFEQALDHMHAQYQDGFAGKVRPQFDPAVYGLDIYYPGEVSEGRVRRFDKFLHLYKLHGSINWSAPNGGKRIEQHAVSLDKFKDWQDLKSIESQAKAFPDLCHISIGILPTAKKFADTLELPYAHLFRSFHQRLQEPQTFLLVIGYGFGDDHINQIIDDAMLNPGLVLLVVDPSPGENTKRKMEQYQSIGERAYLLHANAPADPPTIATFDDFSKSVMPHVKSLDEWVKLRRLEKTIRNDASTDIEGAEN